MSTISIIDKYLRIDGTLISNSKIDFLGFINGNVFVNQLNVKGEANINGNLYSSNYLAIEGGVIEGDIVANTIKISSNAEIKGNLRYVNLSVENGAKIFGSIEKIEEEEMQKIINSALSNLKKIEDNEN